MNSQESYNLSEKEKEKGKQKNIKKKESILNLFQTNKRKQQTASKQNDFHRTITIRLHTSIVARHARACMVSCALAFCSGSAHGEARLVIQKSHGPMEQKEQKEKQEEQKRARREGRTRVYRVHLVYRVSRKRERQK